MTKTMFKTSCHGIVVSALGYGLDGCGFKFQKSHRDDLGLHLAPIQNECAVGSLGRLKLHTCFIHFTDAILRVLLR